jgi:hypothetical protein
VGREDTFVPQHRINRGMGGSKALDRPANILVMCAHLNGLIESSAAAAASAREFGWKLERWMSPEDTPFYDNHTGHWYLIDNEFGRTRVVRAA